MVTSPACAAARRRSVLMGAAGLPLLILSAPRAARGQNHGEALRIAFGGDSLAQGMFLALAPVMRHQDGVRLINGTRHATGLTRTDDYDWPTVLRTLVAQQTPDLLVVWIGANDFRPLVDREARTRLQFGSEAFANAYGARVRRITEDAIQGGAKVAWIGLPNMRESQFANAVRTLNDIQAHAAREAGAVWIPTWEATSDEQGRFRAALGAEQRRFRAEDGVHFSDMGYRRIAGLAFDQIAEAAPDIGLRIQGARTVLQA